MSSEDTVLSEIRQTQKDHTILCESTYRRSLGVRPTETECRREAAGDEGEGRGQLVFNWHRVPVREDERVLETDSGDGGTPV